MGIARRQLVTNPSSPSGEFEDASDQLASASFLSDEFPAPPQGLRLNPLPQAALGAEFTLAGAFGVANASDLHELL